MKKSNLIRIILTSLTIAILVIALVSCGRSFVNYYDKPASETPMWFWLLFM